MIIILRCVVFFYSLDRSAGCVGRGYRGTPRYHQPKRHGDRPTCAGCNNMQFSYVRFRFFLEIK